MKNVTNNEIKLVLESIYKLKKQIATAVLDLKLETETHVPDLMTRIRVLPSVAVVGQKEKVERYMDGDSMLKVSVKYLPRTSEIYGGLRSICTMIKRLPGVKTIVVESYNKKIITLKGQKIIF